MSTKRSYCHRVFECFETGCHKALPVSTVCVRGTVTTQSMVVLHSMHVALVTWFIDLQTSTYSYWLASQTTTMVGKCGNQVKSCSLLW